MSNLEKKWWFVGTVAGLSTFCASILLGMAGMPSREGPAQWAVYFFCMLGFWRCLSFLGWLIVLLAWPSSPLLDKDGARGGGSGGGSRGRLLP